MSFVNIIARAELKEDLYVNDILTCENLINTKNITISGNITLLENATFDGSFINNFVETETFMDAEGNLITNTETINLYEKIERIESKIDANTLAHSTNAGAIASRYTKTAADARFVNNTNATITGDINIRATETDPFETLTTKLGSKVDKETLNDYTTTTDLITELNKKVDVENFEQNYISHLAPLASPSFTGTVLINDFDILNAVETNATDIQTNATAIQNNATDIQTNATAIQNNATAIQNNATAIQTNATNIQTNATAIQTNATAIQNNATDIQTNATAIQNNATAIATKEDIDTLKVMINMLAMSVQPNYIYIDNNINSRFKFARSDQEAANMPFAFLSFRQSIFTSTEEFLQEFYRRLSVNISEIFLDGDGFSEMANPTESGTNGNFTGGFLYKYKVFQNFPSDMASYRLYWMDDYTCNKAGLLSMPQILRTGQLTYTLVDSMTYTITAQYPHFTI